MISTQWEGEFSRWKKKKRQFLLLPEKDKFRNSIQYGLFTPLFCYKSRQLKNKLRFVEQFDSPWTNNIGHSGMLFDLRERLYQKKNILQFSSFFCESYLIG